MTIYWDDYLRDDYLKKVRIGDNMKTMKRIKRIGIIVIENVNAAQENEKTITAKIDVGEGIDKFNYYPENKWKAGPKIDEYFTTVDTRLEENRDVYYTIDFEGTGIEVYGFKAPRHSIVAFSIDGSEPIEVDTFASVRTTNPVLLKEYKDLSNGQHQIKVQATGKTNAAAIFGDIQVSYAKIYKPRQVATSIVFNKESAAIYEGATYQIEYTTSPIDAILPDDFKFTSNDESIATVNDDGLVTAINKGKTEIKGYSPSLGFEANMEIIVEKISDLHATVVDSNDQYQQKHYQTLMNTNESFESLWSWKNDKAISQIALLTGNQDLENVKIEFGEFKNNNGELLNQNNFKATYMKEVKAFIGNAGWYSYNPEGHLPIGPKEDYFDVIYDSKPLDIAKNRVQLVWLDFGIDKDAKAGIYNGKVTISADNTDVEQIIDYSIEVIDADFLDENEYSFRPDFWTYPFSSAEYYGVEPFSDEHNEILKKHLLQYKNYGGTTLTGTLVEEAWGGQTYGKTDAATGDNVRCPSLIKWIKQADGTWRFDYNYFDKFVELAKSIDLGDDIVLYSPMPWNNQIIYYDEASETTKKINAAPGTTAYADNWKPFFKDFADHLDERDWFDDISLGFDERDNMLSVFNIIDQIKNKDGKVFKKQGAYNHIYSNDGVPDRMVSLSFNLNQLRNQGIDKFKKFVADRKAKGLKTSFYTGTEIFPNTFVRSLPGEGYWTMMFSGALDLDYFLDWAYDAWVEDPLVDATHSSFQPGDCFMVYPSLRDAANKESKPSIRSEKYGEGIRDINKLYRIKNECPALEDEIDALFATVKSNYDNVTVQNDPSWFVPGITGRPAYWASEKGRKDILTDVEAFKQGVYEISKKYAELSKTDRSALAIAVELADEVTEEELQNVVPIVVAEFRAAHNYAKEVLNDSLASQETIDLAFTRLANAMHMLEFYKGDKTELQALVTRVEKLEEGNYTSESWAPFKEALDAAIVVIGDDNALEPDVEVAYKNLSEAFANLKLAADKTRLQNFVNQVKDLEESKYTESTWEGFESVLNAAQEVLANEKATQEEVDNAYNDLIRAYIDLRLLPNKDALKDLINKANMLSKASYSEASWLNMENALEVANTVLNNPEASEEQVKAAVEGLQASIEKLEVKAVESTPVKPGDTTTKGNAIKTGDESLIGVFAGLGFLSILGIKVYRKKQS